MTIQVNLPDGSVVNFPDGTPQAEMESALAAHTGPEPASQQALAGMQSEPQQFAGNAVEQKRARRAARIKAEFDAQPGWKRGLTTLIDLPSLIAQGGSLGLLDKAAAAARAPFTDKTYDEELRENRRQTEEARARQGWAGTGAEIGGSIGGGLGLAKNGITLAGRAGTAAMPGLKGLAVRSALMGGEGAGYGAVNAFGADQDVAQGAGMGALFGVGGNVAGDLITGGVDKVAGLFNAKPDRISKEVFKTRAKDAYKEASDAGVWYNPAGIHDLKRKITDDLTDLSYRHQNMPGVKTIIDDLKKLGPNDNMTYEGLESLRQAVGGAYDPLKPANNLGLDAIRTRIDELIDTADPAHITMGQGQQAADAANKARENWSKFRKLDTIDDLVDKGYRMGSRMKSQDVAGATRRQLQKIIDNKKLGRGFSKAEKAALNVASGFTPGMQVLDVVQGMLPQGRLGGLVQGAVTVGSGFNPLVMAGQAAGMAAGYGAKKWQDKLSEMAIDKFVDLVARGGVPAPVVQNAVQKMAKSKQDAVRRALMSGMNYQYNQPAER